MKEEVQLDEATPESFRIFNAASSKWLQDDECSWGPFVSAALFTERRLASRIAARETRGMMDSIYILGEFDVPQDLESAMPKFRLTVRRVWHETFELQIEAATSHEAQQKGETLVNNDPNFREDHADPFETIIECVEPIEET